MGATVRIFYRTQGLGPALLLIHGFPTASWDWHRVAPELARRFTLVAADMIGFGFSAKPRDYDYGIADQATLQERLLAELGIDRVHLLAHDYGDSVAQELLARHLERRAVGRPGLKITSACLLNGGLFPEVHRARPIQRLLASPLGPLVSRFASESTFARSFRAVFGPRTQPSAADLSDFWRLLAHNDGQRIGHRLIRYMEERRRLRARWVGALIATPVPLRLINGPVDPVSGRHLVERYRELVPRADVVVLEGIGHYPQIEEPQGVVRALPDFVASPRAQG